VVVTLGERGVLWIDAQRVEHLPTTPVVALDTSGAGDAFCGAFALALANGDATRTALLKAQRCATLSVTRRGTQASFPTLAELDP
jgi:ribokinase